VGNLDPSGVKVPVGEACQLEIGKVKHRSAFRGSRFPDYFALETPVANKQLVVVPANTFFIVRFLSGGMVFGFETTLKKAYTKPIALWIAEYPDTVQSVNLRKSKRVSVFLPATLKSESGSCEGAMIDLSAGGGLFSCKKFTLKAGEPGHLFTALPSGDRVENLAVQLRNVKMLEEGAALVGLSFESSDDPPNQAINGYYNDCAIMEL